MNNQIKVGLCCIIKNNEQILLGHRSINRKDTGGIYEPDTWTLPGGKQEYNETVIEGVIREVKEETNLDISDIELLSVNDDIQSDRHYVTMTFIANKCSGELMCMEKDKEDEWRFFDIEKIPENIYSPSQKSLSDYKKKLERRN